MFSRPRLIALAFIAASFCFPLTVRSQTKVPLTHEAMWMMKRVGAPNPSPDGKWVVFSLVEPAYDEKDQVSDLWMVPSDGSAKPRRLTFSKGGEGGVAWSPDSRQIAFGFSNQLKKTSTAGGPPQVVCASDSPVGSGAWTADDIIIFGSRGGAGGIKRVSASGGVATVRD